MGSPQSGQPLTSVQQMAHLPRRTNTSQLQTTDTDQPLKYLSQYKIASKNGQESYTHIIPMPVDRFVPPPFLDSKTKHYISTVVHCASLLCQCKATERSENVTSLCVQQPGWSHTLPLLPEVYWIPITDTSAFRTCSGGPFHCTSKWKFSVANNNRVFV